MTNFSDSVSSASDQFLLVFVPGAMTVEPSPLSHSDQLHQLILFVLRWKH
jgi:hypothetical protein